MGLACSALHSKNISCKVFLIAGLIGAWIFVFVNDLDNINRFFGAVSKLRYGFEVI